MGADGNFEPPFEVPTWACFKGRYFRYHGMDLVSKKWDGTGGQKIHWTTFWTDLNSNFTTAPTLLKCIRTGMLDQQKSSFKMAQTWYPLVIQHNYGKSPFLIGKSTKNGPFSIAMLVHQRVTSKNGTTFSGRTRPKIGCTIHPLNRDVPSYKSLINNHPPKRITGGGLGKPKRRGTQPHYRMDGESLQKWFWHVFWGKTNRNHVVANMLQTIL